jgi:hypothetical protein
MAPFEAHKSHLASRCRRLALGALSVLSVCIASTAGATPDPQAWQARYERAKSALAEGRSDEAAREFEALAAEAPTPADQRLARELLSVARAARIHDEPELLPHVRSSDELTVLYATAFVYGIGTSAWVVLLTEPETLPGAVLPFAGLTTTAVAGVAFADSYRPFRRGVPHSIAAGLFLGFGQGVWVVGYQRARATRRDESEWESKEVATALWAGASLGGISGGLVGAWREPTPGRVSFTTSAGVWAGLIGGFTGAALQSNDDSRSETAFVLGGATYNLGILSGIIVAPLIAPSVARVRFADLGAVGGGLLGAGVYAIAAESRATARGGLGFAALGTAAGLGVTWALTEGMPGDPPAKPAGMSVRPFALPTAGGVMLGLNGEL